MYWLEKAVNRRPFLRKVYAGFTDHGHIYLFEHGSEAYSKCQDKVRVNLKLFREYKKKKKGNEKKPTRGV